MSLVTMAEILEHPYREKYAVGAFNILDYASTRAVIEAAVELQAPVIVQTSVKTIKLWGFDPIVSWFRELAGPVDVPVALHLDHCKELDVIQGCVDAGWTSVMIDASSKPFEENMALTRQVVEIARPKGVTVEAELGEISGVEEDIVVSEEDSTLANPERARRFCDELAIDVFAPAIGTAHGVYTGEPKVDFERLETIHNMVPLPIALHGGTGLSDEVFARCISLGCAKVNISTSLKHCYIDSFQQYREESGQSYEPVKYFAYQIERMKADVKGFIKQFGGEGRAAR